MRETFDVFFSYHSKDRSIVRQVAAFLAGKGIRVWIDERELRPGMPWQDGLQEALRESKTAAIFIGSYAFGDWQRSEVRALLQRMAKSSIPIIPVLLPGAPSEPDLGLFLEQNTWVDLRSGLQEDALTRLIWGIDGNRPIEPVSLLPLITQGSRTISSNNDDRARGYFNRLTLAALDRFRTLLRESLRRHPIRVLVGTLTILLLVGMSLLPTRPLSEAVACCSRWAAAALNGRAIQLRPTDRRTLDGLIADLGEFLFTDYSRQVERGDVGPLSNPWEVAQVVVALNGLRLPNHSSIDAQKVRRYFDLTKSRDCNCWKEFSIEEKGRAHTGATAWVLFAKAQLKIPSSTDELRSLLDLQLYDGAWPMFPCREAGSASTYATSLSILALGEYARIGLVRQPMLTDVQNATRQGLSWLESHKGPEHLWKSYPLSLWSVEPSISNSGLALHTLHQFRPGRIKEVERHWMGALSVMPDPAYRFETFDGYPCGENFQREAVHYLLLPWRLIATVDSYGRGNVGERARAIRFAESVISDADIISIRQQWFVGAELLIALRHLRATDSVFKSAVD